MQPEGDRLGGRRLLLLRSKWLFIPECQKAAQHSEQATVMVRLPACSVTNSLLRACEASCACICLVIDSLLGMLSE